MGNNPLRITAYLLTPLATHDDWSPSLEGILELLVLQDKAPDLVSPNPSIEQVKRSRPIIAKHLPLQLNSEFRIPNSKFWKCSSPHYLLEHEQIQRLRKRWDYQEHHCDWGRKKAKFSTSEGHTKSYDLPLYLRTIHQIDWFVVGDKEKLERYLSRVKYLGKKRSLGYGQVSHWEVVEFGFDWSTWRNQPLELMRPLPLQLALQLGQEYQGNTIINWGWKSPVWLPENQAVCLMPNNIIRRQQALKYD